MKGSGIGVGLGVWAETQCKGHRVVDGVKCWWKVKEGGKLHTFTVFGILEVIKDVRKRRISDGGTKIKVN